MNLFFSNEETKQKAIDILNNSSSSFLAPEDALMLLLKDVKYEDLCNLCRVLSEKLNISSEDVYNKIQYAATPEEKSAVLEACFTLLDNNEFLGSHVLNNGINTSSWLSHSLYSAILSSRLASLIGLNSDYAFSYGLLHDYGRKFAHDFTHVTKGFEALVDLGYPDIAKGCLTHSFINKGRNCNNETVNDSFYTDNKGNEHYNECDDVMQVLYNANYSSYDYILNIVDLMATDRGITTPLERIKDIATRRPGIDNSPNRKYFFVSFYNLLVKYINEAKKEKAFSYINYDEVSLEEVKEAFKVISDEIFELQNKAALNTKRGL